MIDGAAAVSSTQPPSATTTKHSSHAIEWRNLPPVSFGDGTTLRAAIKAREPMVLADLAVDWPALERWTPDRLTSDHGQRRVQVYDASFGEPGRGYMSNVDSMSFAEFLRETQDRGRDLRMFLYNLSHQIPELLNDIELPDVGLRFSRRFVFSFFGCRGSTTPLHYDIDRGDVLHTVVRGCRRIRLFPPQAARALYQHPFTVRSYVDLDAPDFHAFPALGLASGYELVLEPGQTLYMPSGWWHEFHYLDAGIGVSLRASSPDWRERIHGACNLLLSSPVDRMANKIAPQAWYQWKRRRAQRLGDALSGSAARSVTS